MQACMDVTAREVRFLALGVAVSAGITSLAYSLYHGNIYKPRRIIDSPLPQIKTNLSIPEQNRLPYPPDIIEGARDVETPYGSIRVYEWGPEDGRKVLFVHGISTPCIALAGLAEELANRGCRVMLFDLFGRGFSSTPDPKEQPQDIRLFTTQMLLVLTSSPLSWVGSQRFTLIGYSLGGGISASFTFFFPNLVESLILIAPAGLMRPSHIHWTSKLLYGGFLPPSWVDWLVRRRLSGSSSGSNTSSQDQKDDQGITDIQVVEQEAPPHPALNPDSPAPVLARRPSVSVADVVAWQLDAHKGFVPAFVSSLQHAPIKNQHERWRLIGERQRTGVYGLCEAKVLLILGQEDDVVIAEETSQDARSVLGDAVDVQILSGGHELPVVSAGAVAHTVTEFWERGTRR